MNISEFKIVFVGGIHGVGKSQFSNKMARLFKIPCLSASSLIAQQRNAAAAINKRVKNVEENQDALITAIELSSIKGEKFILDGHFCVFDTANNTRKISIQTFQKLAPVAAVVLLDDANSIQQRLQARDKNIFQIEMLERLQEAECSHAENVCNHLNIPLRLTQVSEQESALQFVDACLNPKAKL